MILKNDFSWSVSRRNTFEKCKRKYYLSYYGYWGGWEARADELTREIYVLKNLKNKYLWMGSIVHDAIKNLLGNLKQGTIIPEEVLLNNVTKRVKDDWVDSRQGKYRLNPNKYCGLIEDEYFNGISENNVERILNKIEKQLNNFYTSEYFELARSLDHNQWLSLEEYASFILDDTKIHTKIDFAYRFTPRNIIIVDWKTGTSGNIDDFQLTCYSIYAAEKWNISPTDITAVYLFLPTKREWVVNIDDSKINVTKSVIQKSITDMKDMLDDKENNIATIKKFPPTDDNKNCKYCNYKKICRSNNGAC